MSTNVSLQDPFSYSLTILLILLALVLLPAFVFLIKSLISLLKTKKPKPKKKDIPVENKTKDINELRFKYLAMIADTENIYAKKQISPRQAYLKLSQIVREFVHDVTGVNTQNLTLAEIKALSMPTLYSLIDSFYRPEFAEEGNYEKIGEAFELAKGVVEQWN